MELTPEERRQIYEEEKARIEAEETTPIKAQDKKPHKNSIDIKNIAIPLILIIGGTLFLANNGLIIPIYDYFFSEDKAVHNTAPDKTIKTVHSLKNPDKMFRQFEGKLFDRLDYTWKIIDISIKDRILTIVPDFDHINKKGYVSMIPWICMELCKYPGITKQLEEIRILNVNQNQGWVYVEPRKCDQIIHATLNKVDEFIISKSREFDPYEERREQVSVNAKMHLRSEPTTLTYDDVKRMLVQHNFYSDCDKWSKGACNPKGNFQNDFVDNGNGTITDRKTGLMWQKNSSHHMEGSDAQVYVATLNRKRFLGYTDWRLPTIEELASLIESKKSSEGLHMSPLFSQKKESYWSSDKLEPNVLWCVNFYAGAVIPYFHKTWQNMVRAVR